MRPKLSYANVMATIAVFIALGGASYAATQLPKNSVGTKQLKKNAVNGSKVKDRSLTGKDIDPASLGTVPRAIVANTAETATSANTSSSANVASSLASPEPWHYVGTPNEPQFQGSCKNTGGTLQTVRFYKDHEGVVHLEGRYECATPSSAFYLPAGYRPGAMLQFAMGASFVGIFPSTNTPLSGSVACSALTCFLNGITFRAES